MKEISQVDKRINECIVQRKTQPFEQLDRQIMNVSKSVCKLKIETLSETIIGTGFLLKFGINQEPFYCLMSNELIIRKDIINKNNDKFIFVKDEHNANI